MRPTEEVPVSMLHYDHNSFLVWVNVACASMLNELKIELAKNVRLITGFYVKDLLLLVTYFLGS